MIYFLVTWIAWTCPGGILGGLVPAPVRPLACRAEPRFELYDPARRGRAQARVRELGPGAEMRRCRGLRCSDNLAQWNTELTFKGE